MGMRQRLAIAAALLGDPEVLIFDEPTNGLDPPGIRWLRDLLRAEAGRGRAVLVSSHLLAEVAQSVDEVVIIARGELRAQGPLEQVLGREGGANQVYVRSTASDRLAEALGRQRLEFQHAGADALLVSGASSEQVATIAGEAGAPLLELTTRGRSLEDAFVELTADRP